jgi:hypothetical protein
VLDVGDGAEGRDEGVSFARPNGAAIDGDGSGAIGSPRLAVERRERQGSPARADHPLSGFDLSVSPA